MRKADNGIGRKHGLATVKERRQKMTERNSKVDVGVNMPGV
jgi:hypothetical protein